MTEERSLAETPTWSVATVTTVLVGICFIVERSIHHFGKWLVKTKRKPLLAALTKIKDELMLLGFISLFLGQSARWISNICVKSSLYSSRFYPCTKVDFDKDDGEGASRNLTTVGHMYIAHYGSYFSHRRRLVAINHCSKGHEPFVSFESLEQLHRFLFILGVSHVFYCCLTMLLAMIKIYKWRPWELEAHAKLIIPDATRNNAVFRRQSTFVIHQTSHPWSKNKVLIWVLCFVRQFARSVKKEDYTALRLGFIKYHGLRFTYDFHSYMVRTMEDEFRDIVGISWVLWGYAIFCIFFNFHGLNFYFWISFIPTILILFIGAKLQHVMANLALDDEAAAPGAGIQLKPHDGLFWFGKPQLLLWLIQFISFQNAFEMATFVWSWWEIKEHTCFMKDRGFVYTRLISGLLVQFWCSYGILPLYAIVTQMGSRFKKALIREEIRESLHGWRQRVKDKAKRESIHSSTHSTSAPKLAVASESIAGDKDETNTEVAAHSFSRSQSNVTRRSSSLPKELSITCQTDNLGEDYIQSEEVQQQEESLGSFVFLFKASNNALPIELDIVDDDDIDEDPRDEHRSSNDSLSAGLDIMDDDDDNTDED